MDTQTNAPDFVLFLGRFHPLIVHLPIGLLILAFIMEVLTFFPKFKKYNDNIEFVLLIGAISAVGAAIIGYMLSLGGGYNEDLVDTHMWQGIGVSVLAILAYLIKTRGKSWIKNANALKYSYPAVVAFMFLLLVGAGHNGGSLTHGDGYLTQYAPNAVRWLAGLPPKSENTKIEIPDIQQAVAYRDVIAPMLEQRCNKCHNESKKKGKLRMDTYTMMEKGGKTGPVFVAGNAGESEMVKRVNLPEDDDDHMPPDGKTPLTENQIAILTWWINAGASEDKKVAELEVSDEIQPLLAMLETGGGAALADGASLESEKTMPSVAPASEGAIQKAREMGISVNQIAQNTNFLEANFINADTLTQDMMKALDGISDQLIWLNLGRTKLNDDLAKGLAPLKNVTKLHLENTEISDAGLQHIAGFENLEYLNLYGTQISDAGLKHLENMSKLKSLYLWQTQATKEGVADLKMSIPNLEENMGYEAEQASAAE